MNDEVGQKELWTAIENAIKQFSTGDINYKGGFIAVEEGSVFDDITTGKMSSLDASNK